jgi:hypothetical protein
MTLCVAEIMCPNYQGSVHVNNNSNISGVKNSVTFDRTQFSTRNANFNDILNMSVNTMRK